jgi:cardiolipin synthase
MRLENPEDHATSGVMATRDQQRADASTPYFEIDGTTLAPIVGGPERLAALVALIEAAARDLRLIYYIFSADTAGTAVRDALVRAAERGVRVSLLIDGFGSEHTPESFFAPVLAAGGAVCRFLPRFGRRYLLRNHQKLALADGTKALIGGFNIDAAYFAEGEADGWRDFALRVDGAATGALTGYVDALLEWAREPRSTVRALARLIRARSEDQGRTRWLFGGPTRRLNPWTRALHRDLRGAVRVDVIAAYFAPNPGTLRRLGRLARRGIVRIVTSARSDNSMTIAAARHCYTRLLRRGARIWEYQPMRLHTKIFVVDDTAYVGSANFDVRSLYLNLEIMLRVEDTAFAEWLRGHFDRETADCREASLDRIREYAGWWLRLRWRLAYFIVSAVDYTVTRRINFRSGESAIG